MTAFKLLENKRYSQQWDFRLGAATTSHRSVLEGYMRMASQAVTPPKIQVRRVEKAMSNIDATKKVPMTKMGAKYLEEELHELKTIKRPQVIEAIAVARAH